METLQILGWVYLGITLGSVFGVMALSLFIGPRIKGYLVDIADLEEEIISLRLQRQALKEEILKLSKRGKPAPRKRRNWKRKPRKK